MAARKISNMTRGVALMVMLLLVANTVLAILLSRWSERALTEQIQVRMLDVANSAASLLDGDSLATISADDKDTPAYQHAMDMLTVFQNNTELSYIYCLRQTADGGFEFTVDPTVDDPAAFGESVHYTDALGRAAEGVSSVDLVPYEDRWGRFYSAYAPVFDTSGNIAGIVGVDFSASWYEQRTAQINGVVVGSCIASLVMAIIAMLVVSKLVSAEEHHVKSLRRAIQYDNLTGLPKMSRFFELATAAHEKMVDNKQEACILYADLVGLRFFNQRMGFAEGDKLLKAFANMLTKHFGSKNCGRLGQDEFAVVTNAEDLDARLDTFLDDCAKMNDGNNLPVRIGIYKESQGEADVSTACDRAKAASDAHRDTYGSTYEYFNETMLAKIRQRQYVTSNIDRAISEGWIKVYYQPIVRAANGRVCDEESLARWDDPELGFLSPAQFIPALEDTNLVYKLDLNVLEQTLMKMRHLAEVGLYVVPSSINLSRSDFLMCDMVEEVRKRVDEAGISHDMINVEITESAIGRDFDFMKKQVDRFHELGFRVWMDDFGSEYSSLDYLQSLNFDLIKFDMRFMKRFDNDSRSRVILTELTRMAIGLGIDTVVEGVETEEQMNFLREIGSDKLQGYYFTTPHSMEEVLRRYEDGTAIGFENPAESEYYAALGRVSLYDLSSVARDDDDALRNYFDTLPMVIIELTDETFLLVRHNAAYRTFMANAFRTTRIGKTVSHKRAIEFIGTELMEGIVACSEVGDRAAIEGRAPNGTVVNAFVRCVAKNPVTHTRALVGAILSSSDPA